MPNLLFLHNQQLEKSETLVLLFKEGENGHALFSSFPTSLRNHLQNLLEKEKEIIQVSHPLDVPFQEIILIKGSAWKELGAKLYWLGKTSLSIGSGTLSPEEAADFLFGLFLPEKRPLIQCSLLSAHPERMKEAFQSKDALLEGIYLTKELTDAPPNIIYPETFVKRLMKLTAYGLEVEVLDEKALQQHQFNLLTAVAKGSRRPPFVALLRWQGKDESPHVLVGKGVTFDTGGLCLKKPQEMLEMKRDKAGAGVVAGTLLALALEKVPRHVIGVIGLVENMPGDNAFRPSDVISTMIGKTVEIVDTDNEGRLVLADCLAYVEKHLNPASLIDLGTLTLESFAALGKEYAALFSNNSSLADQIKQSAAATGDKVWELPMGPSFAAQLQSDYADFTNGGVPFWGESGAAAEFLRKFVQTTPWAHLDIAGTSWVNENTLWAKKGTTAFGVQLLYHLIQNIENQEHLP